MSEPCADKLETLGAWLDGEATEAEARELERHLEACAGCREASRMLADLGSSVAHQPTLAPPPDFAVRTARAVVPAAPGWRFPDLRGRSVALALAQMLARGKEGRPGPARVMLLFGLPALAFGLFNPLLTVWFLKIAAVCLLAGLPVHYWQGRVARLGSLQRGRALEEILLTGVSRAQLLDAVAVSGLGALAWAGLGFAPLLALADPGAGFLWLPVLLLVAWLGSYAAACWSLGGGWRLGVLAVLGGLGLVLWPDLSGAESPLVRLATSQDVADVVVQQVLRWGPALVICALCLLVARGFTLRLLEREPSRPRGKRNRWLLAGSDNPVVMRENVRRAARAPRSLAVVGLIHCGPVLVSVALAGSLLDSVESQAWAWIYLLAAGVLAWTATRTLGAVLHERERGTWDTLLQTGAVGLAFVAGWVQVAVSEAFLAFLSLLGLPLLVAGLLLEPAVPLVAAFATVGAGLTGTAALLGLALSARSRTLGEARASLLAWGCGTALASLGLMVVAPAVVGPDDWEPWVLPLVAVACVGLLVALWSAFTLKRHLLLSAAIAGSGNLRSRLAVCSGWAGAALTVAANSWPVWPSSSEALLQAALGYGLGWLAGVALAWLVAPVLRFEGRTLLARWLVTLLWGIIFGLALGGLRLLMVCLDWFPAHWAYDQIALAVAVSAGVAALLGLRTSDAAAAGSFRRALVASFSRAGVALALLAAYMAWEYRLPPADAEPFLAQVRAQREAARQLPPPVARLEGLLRGNWPSGASGPYVDPDRLRSMLPEVRAVVRHGEFPVQDPAFPFAMRPALLEGVADALVTLHQREPSLDCLLLAVEWSARGRQLSYAHAALNNLRLVLDSLQLTDAELRRLLARTEGLDRLDFTPVCDDWFAMDLRRLERERIEYPDRPEFYWRHQRDALIVTYLRTRPLCIALADSRSIRLAQRDAFESCGPHAPAAGRPSNHRARYWVDDLPVASLVDKERSARRSLLGIRAEAQRQLEDRR